MNTDLQKSRTFSIFGKIFSEEEAISVFKEKLGDRDLVSANFVEPGNIVDVGCCTGAFVDYLAKIFPHSNIIGIDHHDEHIKIAKFLYPHIKDSFIKMDFYRHDFTRESIDCVTCLEVLEHLEDVNLAIKKVNYILSPGGCFIASIPNPYHYKRFLNFCFTEIKRNFLMRFYKKTVPLKSERTHKRLKAKWIAHLYSWTPSTLLTLLEINGFSYLHHAYGLGSAKVNIPPFSAKNKFGEIITRFLRKLFLIAFPFFGNSIILKVKKIETKISVEA